jgi:putative transcriptional regulator
MKSELFDELVQSVREGGSILRGEIEPSRKFVIGAPDVKAVRTRFNLTQYEFAALLGISVKTLQNWEQGRRTPHGPARVLLQVAEKHPEAVWDVVFPKRKLANTAYKISPQPALAFHESNSEALRMTEEQEEDDRG